MDSNLYLIAAALASGILGGGGIGFLLKTRNAGGTGLVGIEASTVAGRGAFALKNIREGATVERCPALEVTDRDVGGELLNYVFYGSDEKKRLVAMGNGMLFNHSSTPNVAYYLEETSLGPELVIYALRNIERGEELFYNYGDDWWSTRQ
ncbi:MAG: SET domain-containing protein-lysine N-methyltransferase [Chlorobium sp.]|uniref:SET domain-containing protein-lysine N-methyltransferase n=1 Tax=Chlorobium sp. TaxID=1095 RepID=UPI0025B8F4D6|nr:SET domain-containing protein-lysine N-methyltransferase [Chlorobium sp.]MCF8382912.1 SET domain-containing protein-lysine N-methyltransferase [Chlorobium sp.]